MFARTTVYVQLMRSRWVYRLKRWQQFVLLCLLFQGWSSLLTRILFQNDKHITEAIYASIEWCDPETFNVSLRHLCHTGRLDSIHTVQVCLSCCASQNVFYLDKFCNRHCKCSVGNLFAPRRELKVFIIPSNSNSLFIHDVLKAIKVFHCGVFG